MSKRDEGEAPAGRALTVAERGARHDRQGPDARPHSRRRARAAHGRRRQGLVLLAGRPMLAHAIDRLRPQFAALALSANGDPARFEAFDLPVVPDDPPELPGRSPALSPASTIAPETRRGSPMRRASPPTRPSRPEISSQGCMRRGARRAPRSPSPPRADAPIASPRSGRWRLRENSAARS